MAAPPQPQPEPEPAAGGAGLEALEGLALDTVIAKAGARQAAALACASTRLRDAAGDDALWRRFCADDLALHAPLAPDGRALPSFKVGGIRGNPPSPPVGLGWVGLASFGLIRDVVGIRMSSFAT